MKFKVEDYLEYEQECREIEEWYQTLAEVLNENAGDR